MKKVFYFAVALLVALSFASCKADKNQNNEEETTVETVAEEATAEATEAVTELSETAKAAIATLGEGFFGTYVTTLPGADNAGFETTLTLNADFTYTWEQKVVDGEALPKEEGKIVDLNENLIVKLLSNEGETKQFKLVDGKLFMLDVDGNEIEGATRDAYFFTRK